MRSRPPFGGLGGPDAQGGTVYIVGGGPGEPGYLTLRAATLLATCDVVAYDHLSPPEALELVPAYADRILVGRRSGAPGYERDELDELLLARAAAGDAVVRLKGGDPFVFGRGGEEASACVTAGQPFEVVPGVSSPIAVPGAAGIPVTHRVVSRGFAVVTGHQASGDDEGGTDAAALAAFPGTLVLLMGLARLRDLADALVANGRSPATPAAVVSAGTMPSQRSVRATLATIADEAEKAEVPTPAVIVVGEVVALAETLSQREQRPLHGLTVLLPRLSGDPSSLAAHLRHAGAAVTQVPLAEERSPDPATFSRLAVDVLEGRVGTLVVLDARGVDRLVASLLDVGGDVRGLAPVRLVAVGETTADRLARDHGVAPDRTFGTGAELRDAPDALTGNSVVLAPLGDDRGLAEALGARSVASSRLVPVDVAGLPDGDVMILPASRLVASALEQPGSDALPLVALGPATSAEVRAHGRDVDAEAAEPTAAALIAALRSFVPAAP
jgi:uroporphyrinogen III methyltransferase / synthase